MVQTISINGYVTGEGNIKILDKNGNVKSLSTGTGIGSNNGYFPQGW